ncbi:MAG: citramalate synthase [Polyangiaceae bacterium]|nr:citramalate synthase [Polyangiaceae bacterium]
MSTPEPEHVAIYDTTLRDGTQREGLSLSAVDKVQIAHMLDVLGVDFVELGWPGSNPKDAEVFERARDLAWSCSVAAFGSTCRGGLAADGDPQVAALLATEAPVCTIFGKSSLVHVREVLRVEADENLRMIAETVGFLVAHGRRVVYDAEHFFDGCREDASYALETVRAAARGGASVVTLCDSNGGSLPWEIEARVREVAAAVGVPVGIHTHDDTGCGVANALAAVRAGASQVQGTVNGYGERCGNANLCSIIPTLELKMGKRCLRAGALSELTHVARQVAEIANLAPDAHAPYVGRSAFAHKGGVHVAAIRRHPRAYEHVDPALVGNRTRVVVSELSGRGNVIAKAEEYGVELEAGMDSSVLRGVKELEARGYAFESAEASVALLMRRQASGYAPPFELVDYKVIMHQRPGDPSYADAAIKMRVRGDVVHTAAEGNGPVSALDAALRKALVAAYPEVDGIRLEDYKVRILDGDSGTESTVRVLVESGFGDERWTTVGASSNVVEASWLALVDGIEYGLSVARAARASEKGAA